MAYLVAADALVLLHLGFILFVLCGGLLVLWRPWLALVHLPCAAWGVLVEVQGWICPLTPWENSLRRAAGQAGYQGGFIEHYIVPLIYPDYLDPQIQLIFGALVVVLNLMVYGWVLYARRR